MLEVSGHGGGAGWAQALRPKERARWGQAGSWKNPLSLQFPRCSSVPGGWIKKRQRSRQGTAQGGRAKGCILGNKGNSREEALGKPKVSRAVAR